MVRDNRPEEKLVLNYFDGFGRGEIIRLILHHAEVPFRDNRISFMKWPRFKKVTPLGAVPTLEITLNDGSSMVLCQSAAIARYLAARFDLAGKTAVESCYADEAFESLNELVNDLINTVVIPDSERREEEFAKYYERRTAIFTHLERRLDQNSNGGSLYLAGGQEFTYADIAVAGLLDLTAAARLDLKEVESVYPKLWALACRVRETSGIKTYLANRESDKLFNIAFKVRAVLGCCYSLRRLCCCCCRKN